MDNFSGNARFGFPIQNPIVTTEIEHAHVDKISQDNSWCKPIRVLPLTARCLSQNARA